MKMVTHWTISPLILMTLKHWKSITMHCIAVIMMQFAFEFKTNINLINIFLENKNSNIDH